MVPPQHATLSGRYQNHAQRRSSAHYQGCPALRRCFAFSDRTLGVPPDWAVRSQLLKRCRVGHAGITPDNSNAPRRKRRHDPPTNDTQQGTVARRSRTRSARRRAYLDALGALDRPGDLSSSGVSARPVVEMPRQLKMGASTRQLHRGGSGRPNCRPPRRARIDPEPRARRVRRLQYPTDGSRARGRRYPRSSS